MSNSMNKLIKILILCSSINTYCQEVVSSKVIYKFNDYSPIGRKLYYNRTIIVLETGFTDDRIKLYINKKLISSGIYTTSENNYNSAGELYDFKSLDCKKYKIELINKGQKIKFSTNKNYNYIFLYKKEKSWIVEYRFLPKIVE